MSPFGWVVPFLFAAPSSKVTFEVCLSPGCVADGAEQTLAKLQALSSVEVKPGTCESLCGKGPIVTAMGDKKVIHKRISGDALLELLSENGEIDQVLLKGYEFAEQANECYIQKDYEKAISLYQKGIAMALDPAKEQQENEDDDTMARRLEWLVRAYCQQAQAHLALNNADGALIAAQAACDLSNNADATSLETLAEVCQVSNDAKQELHALQSLFALPQNPNPPRDVANRRRTLGFRLAKLEREVGATQ